MGQGSRLVRDGYEFDGDGFAAMNSITTLASSSP